MQKPNLQRQLVSLLFKHKGLITIVFFFTVITVTVVSFARSPVYEANSNLLIKFGREYIYQAHGEGDKAPYNYFQEDRIVNTEIEILTSQGLLKKVIEHVGIDKLYPELAEADSENEKIEKALDIFRKNLTTLGMDKGNVLRVSFQHTDPEVAALAVNTLIEYFKQKRLSVYGNSNVFRFMEQEVHNYKRRLTEANNSLGRFRKKHATYSLDEQKTLSLNQLFELNSAYKKSFSEIAEIEHKLISLQHQKDIRTTHSVLFSDSGETNQQAQNKLLELRLKEEQLLTKFTEKNPLIIQTRKEIQLVRNFLNEKKTSANPFVRTGKSEVYRDIEKAIVIDETALQSIEAKNYVLAAQISEVEEQLRNLTTIENDLSSKIVDVEVYGESYRAYRKKLEESRISKELDRQVISNIRVIQEATVPVEPIKPKKSVNILLSIFFGAFAGIGLALLREYLGQGISNPLGIEHQLGLPVFASIPHIETSNQLRIEQQPGTPVFASIPHIKGSDSKTRLT